ncbi:hypothetical protein V6Z12_D11G380600 [Gossypium hirsutum]
MVPLGRCTYLWVINPGMVGIQRGQYLLMGTTTAQRRWSTDVDKRNGVVLFSL